MGRLGNIGEKLAKISPLFAIAGSTQREALGETPANSKIEQRMVERASVILLACNGLSGKEIALKMGTRQARVSTCYGDLL